MIEGFRRALREINRGFGVLKQGPYNIGLSLSQCHILVDIKEGVKVTASNLSASLRLEKSSISRLLKQLERKGLITFKTSELDRRCKYLVLTNYGEKELAYVHRKANQAVEEVFELFSSDEQKKIVAAFELVSQKVSIVSKGHNNQPILKRHCVGEGSVS